MVQIDSYLKPNVHSAYGRIYQITILTFSYNDRHKRDCYRMIRLHSHMILNVAEVSCPTKAHKMSGKKVNNPEYRSV